MDLRSTTLRLSKRAQTLCRYLWEVEVGDAPAPRLVELRVLLVGPPGEKTDRVGRMVRKIVAQRQNASDKGILPITELEISRAFLAPGEDGDVSDESWLRENVRELIIVG